MGASYADISRAANDEDLVDRLVSAAAEYGVPNPEGWVHQHARRIVSAKVTEADDTVASVYAYAVATYNPTPRPGANEAAVTDLYLRTAIETLYGEEKEA